MKEKELRLALVCYGGVSLAVYMHGITKEIWKLQRASKTWRDIKELPEDEREAALRRTGHSLDTEKVYFDLLARLAETVDLRVLVDVIAGASAGGINGVFLAKAIAEDLSLEPLTDLWMRNADVEKLLDPRQAATPWSKAYMRPLLWLYQRWRARRVDEEDVLGEEASDEVRAKFSALVRSRWFEPPFSGEGFARLLYEGLEAMQRTGVRAGSLLPVGHPLDLVVTVTDYHGHNQTLRLNSPPRINEREHRLIISFHDPGTHPQGRRKLGENASLAFAARATASFPGAFPPASISEVDKLLAERGQVWRERSAFIEQLFPTWTLDGRDPANIPLMDGSVLNNKPFDAAIRALRDRPAHREVDRRVVYIEPYPKDLETRRDDASFFGAIVGALSTIPRQQPIRDDLERLQNLTAKLGSIRSIIDSLTPDIETAIEDAFGERLHVNRATPQAIAQWRILAQQRLADRSGFTYKGYAELKTARVLEEMASLFCILSRRHSSTAHHDMLQLVRHWAEEAKILPLGAFGSAQHFSEHLGEHLPWLQFLRRFDLGFRIRRLRFVIRRVNDLYGTLGVTSHEALDVAKSHLYAALAPMLQRQTGTAAELKDLPGLARLHLDPSGAITALGDALKLVELDEEVDRRMSECVAAMPDAEVGRQVLLAFLGFPFFDLVTLPMLEHGTEELEGIKVDRLSPLDATSLRDGGAETTLKGIQFATFGAFLSRAYRENDYLWGRLHAAERMIDILLSSAAPAVHLPALEVARYKRQAFLEILQAERPRLRRVTGLIDQLLAEIYAQHPEDADAGEEPPSTLPADTPAPAPTAS
ncbi:patatin-like protein [Pedomonas mirosovicensis]|uniref:patatin-like protein n=1 Tax=Pedomonas mirosovicensis TaxID=2908641 RepID=UPI002168263F|nr:patatin-like protein [Pedomonas mirosovicensis]MCH8685988.1 patatin-like protein [Pedomonas mirosovicensis]